MPPRHAKLRASRGRRLPRYPVALAAVPVLFAVGAVTAAVQAAPAPHAATNAAATSPASTATPTDAAQATSASATPSATAASPGSSATAAPTTTVSGRNAPGAGNTGPTSPGQGRDGGHQHKPGSPQNPPAANPVCTLAVPANPLTAAGLAQPYELSATNDADGACNEANPNQSAFVEATILDPATGAVSIYRPLVVDQGSTPAAKPTAPAIPANGVVGIWFGFNGDTLTLQQNQNSSQAGSCVNGLAGSPFGQFGYCNAPAFFSAANNAISKGQLHVPALGMGKDGMTCPTTRDFGVVDQDQSDNVTTRYLATPDGRTAQYSAANTAAMQGAQPVTNGSDNGLLDSFVDPALGCSPFTAPDQTNGGTPGPSLALNELQAAADQAQPIALVPLNDPMAQVGTTESVAKTNLYRSGVNQPAIQPNTETDAAYCSNLANVSARRLATDRRIFQGAPSPDPANAANLDDFLKQRRATSLQKLNCGG